MLHVITLPGAHSLFQRHKMQVSVPNGTHGSRRQSRQLVGAHSSDDPSSDPAADPCANADIQWEASGSEPHAEHLGIKHRCPAFQSSLDYTEADLAVGMHLHHLIPPGAGERATEVLHRMEDIAPADIDQARGLGSEPDKELGPGGEPRRQAERHHGDGSRGPVGGERDIDMTGDFQNGMSSMKAGNGGAFRSGSETLWGSTHGPDFQAQSACFDISGSSGKNVAGRLGDEHVPERLPGQTYATLSTTGIELGSETQVREVEQRISGGVYNISDVLSHPERFGASSSEPVTSLPSEPPPRPRYGGHLAADQDSAAKMGSQGAVRATEAAISLPSRPANPSSGNVVPTSDVIDGGSTLGVTEVGVPEGGEGADTSGQGGVAGGVTAVIFEAAHSVGATMEGLAEGVAGAAAQTWSAAETAGRLIGSAAGHIAEDATAKTHGSKAREDVNNEEERGSNPPPPLDEIAPPNGDG